MREGEGGDEWRLHLAEDLGAEAQAVGELPQAQGLQVGRQRRHHPQQQLGKVLRLDLNVCLLHEDVQREKVRGRSARSHNQDSQPPVCNDFNVVCY